MIQASTSFWSTFPLPADLFLSLQFQFLASFEFSDSARLFIDLLSRPRAPLAPAPSGPGAAAASTARSGARRRHRRTTTPPWSRSARRRPSTRYVHGVEKREAESGEIPQ